MRYQLGALLAGVIIFSLSCTPSVNSNSKNKAEEEPVKEVIISTVGESMMFDKQNFTVKSGEKVTVTFKNQASSMKHNWVLTESGKSDKVGMDGIKAGEIKSYVPDSQDVLAHSKLIGKGEDTVSFVAPKPGDYPYICTFPGHYTVMKGIMHSVR